jgi:IclR family pca regulon transcriptional regulator
MGQRQTVRDEILTRNPTKPDDEGKLFVASLAKGMRALYAFGGNEAKLTATQVARLSGLDASSAQRFIYTLTALGFLEKVERTKQYRLSARLLDFAYLFLRSDPLCAIANSHLLGLAEATGESVHLSILDGADVIYLSRHLSARHAEVQNFVGGRMPSLFTSNGRVMLSALPRDAVRQIINTANLTPLTPQSPSDPDYIMAKIDQAGRDGWALVIEESERNAMSLAAPVVDPTGRTVAAINIPVSKDEWTSETVMQKLYTPLMRTAQIVGRSLMGADL